MRRVVLYFYLVLAFFFVSPSCSKDDDVVTVEGNVAPPDTTIEEVTYSNYVNKLYIALLGRKATTSENESGVSALKVAGLSASSRTALIATVHGNEGYFDNEYALMRSNYLNDADSADFAEAKSVIEFAKTVTANPVEIAYLDDQLVRMQPLIELEGDLKSGNKTVIEAHKIIVDNYVYDQINMGSENYVVSLYQNFLLRYPTTVELDAGKNMFDGQPDILFGMNGKTKVELNNIFFADLSYFEGQVRQNFLRFLYREPTNNEIDLLAAKYMQDGNYKALQSYVLSLDEYVGL